MMDTDAALKPLLQMANESSKNMDTNRALVLKALSDPMVFCGFDQLKTAMELEDDHVLGRSLNLFSYGTYSDYKTAEAGHFVSLSDAQTAKLRQLTVLSLVQQACFEAAPIIPYATLSQALDVNNQIDVVEEILVSCIYAGMMSGQLCQKTQSFILSSTMPYRSRDVPQTNDLLQRLTSFRSRLDSTLAQMFQAKEGVKAKKQVYDNFRKQHHEQKPTGYQGAGFRARDRPATRASNKRTRGGLAAADPGGRF